MQDIIKVTYSQTGQSSKLNSLGMREMQEKAYQGRNSQYLLLKAPPASGKSRALMYIALDKLYNQNIQKVIVAVPEKAIGGSFSDTNLTDFGFFADWKVNPIYNLCTNAENNGKVDAFINFLVSGDRILICTHSTLRFAFEQLKPADFNNTLLAIDEFHHVSADAESRLGELLKTVINESNAHIIAMTGSYFRGDCVPILQPEDESRFTKITYNYYEQLNGYTYLKSLGIGYHFYQGRYTSAIMEILDTDKKTILHIPSVNSGESTKEKHKEVGFILDAIGKFVSQDEDTGVISIKRHSDDKIIKVADLVEDTPKIRDKIVAYLRNMKNLEDMDLIIALGMAKEGFDWPYCEHALTVGYRGSLTEVIQIIGRCTRDSSNKIHAQFTNLIAQPDAEDEMVTVAVNNMLKAISASLLMEQVLAPNFKFKTKINDEDLPKPGEIKIRGLKEPSSKRVKDIVESDLNDLKAAILQDDTILKAIPGQIDPEVINKVLIPKIIQIKYPELSEEETEEVRQYVIVDSLFKSSMVSETGSGQFVKLADRFVNIDDLHIDLIDTINPFQKAYEIISKLINAPVLKAIRDTIEANRISMTQNEAIILWPKIQEFFQLYKREPNINSADPLEKRMAEALIYLKDQKRKALANG